MSNILIAMYCYAKYTRKYITMDHIWGCTLRKIFPVEKSFKSVIGFIDYSSSYFAEIKFFRTKNLMPKKWFISLWYTGNIE